MGVSVVYLFGSGATGRKTSLSDVDIGVVVRNPPLDWDTRRLYHALYELFSERYPASRVDIVLLQRTPLSLQYAAIREGKPLLEENPVVRADYEYGVVNQYLDFKTVLELFDRVTEKRYAET